MALSSSARAALEKFKSQQTGGEDDATGVMDLPPLPSLENHRTESAPSMASLLRGVLPSENEGELFRPEQPKNFEDSGISYRVLESLILKAIKQEGPCTEIQLADFLHVSANVFREILKSLHKRELLDTPMPETYDLTTKGREMTGMVEREDGYIGPVPVSFDAYCKMVRAQAKRERRVSMEDVENVETLDTKKHHAYFETKVVSNRVRTIPKLTDTPYLQT